MDLSLEVLDRLLCQEELLTLLLTQAMKIFGMLLLVREVFGKLKMQEQHGNTIAL